jgi:DNA-binding CsgD family transcriptional regulator
MSIEEIATSQVDLSRGLLLERGQVLESIADRVTAARAGSGSFAVVLARAGLGKTALLDRVAALAAENGLAVTTARAGELERGMPFGVARQLFALPVRGLSSRDRRAVLAGTASQARGVIGLDSETAADDPIGVMDGLYWLAANLAYRTPLVLVIDDLHWIDPQTARWLAYLERRIGDVPLLVVAAARPGGGPDDVSSQIGRHHTIELSLAPLSRGAVSEIVQAQFGRRGEARFVDACHAASGGNPFYVCELLRAAAEDGLQPVDAHAGHVSQLGPREVRRSILVRLARLGEGPRRLAAAVAILGTEAEIRHAAQLCEITIDEALTAWGDLVHAEIMRDRQPLEFFHPIIRAAVHDEMLAGERSRAHRRAAELLAADQAPLQQVALHAVACERLGDDQVVEWLRQAAHEARSSGAPDAAARYLDRALQEPPPPAKRALLHFEAGQALMGIDTVAAAAEFAAAAADATGSYELAAQRWRGYSLAYAGQMRDAIASFDRAIELAEGDPELTMHLSGTRDFYATWWADDPGRAQRQQDLRALAETLDGATAGQRRVLASAALNLAHTGAGPAALALSYVQKASRRTLSWLDLEDGSETCSAVGNTLTICDDPAAAGLYTGWLEEVRRQGWSVNIGAGYFQRAIVRFRQGALLEAEADARTSWKLLEESREASTMIYSWSASALLEVLIARGKLDEAVELAAAAGLEHRPLDVVIYPWPAVLLGELDIACGHYQQGIDRLLQAGEWLEERGFTNPAYISWRAIVAPALAANGKTEQAHALIEPAVLRARSFGTPWALGMALRACGTVEQGPNGIKLLREAVSVLESCDCRLEHAHALLELGACLRRSNQRANAREALRAAVDAAHRCAAEPLTARAERELLATGARPRRLLLSGVDALTASELRVAELAAQGLSNPEIAQRLFVTRKTIETHLGHVYLKLGIESREQLADAL